jgi:hypothetical protein
MTVKHELQNIISGNGSVRHGKTIQTIASYLSGKKKAVSDPEKTKFSKLEETKALIEGVLQFIDTVFFLTDKFYEKA